MKEKEQNESMVMRQGKDGRTMVSAEAALKMAKERAKEHGMGDKKSPITMQDHLRAIMKKFTQKESQEMKDTEDAPFDGPYSKEPNQKPKNLVKKLARKFQRAADVSTKKDINVKMPGGKIVTRRIATEDVLSFREYRDSIMEARKLCETHCEVGDTVVPNTGPHKGVEHTVVAVHEGDKYTIKPNLPKEENKYKEGAIIASGSSFQKTVDEASPFDILKGKGHYKSTIDWSKDDKWGDDKKKDDDEEGVTRHKKSEEKPKKDPNAPKKSVGRPKGKYGEYKINRGDKERAAIGAKVHGNPERKKNLADTIAVRKEFKAAMDKAIRDRQAEIYNKTQKNK